MCGHSSRILMVAQEKKPFDSTFGSEDAQSGDCVLFRCDCMAQGSAAQAPWTDRPRLRSVYSCVRAAAMRASISASRVSARSSSTAHSSVAPPSPSPLDAASSVGGGDGCGGIGGVSSNGGITGRRDDGGRGGVPARAASPMFKCGRCRGEGARGAEEVGGGGGGGGAGGGSRDAQKKGCARACRADGRRRGSGSCAVEGRESVSQDVSGSARATSPSSRRRRKLGIRGRIS